MRKFTLLVVLAVALTSAATFADPIVELSAPRLASPKVISDEGSPVKAKVSTEAPKSLKGQSKTKRVKRHIRKKPVVIKVDYDKVSKLIEYNYFDEADNVLQGAIRRNPKDVNALSLSVVSMAKQCMLDPAQSELNELLKKYPDNSNLHYAQGVVYYQRTTSSNMFYRNNCAKLTDNAFAEFKKAVDLDKTNARALNALGVLSLNAGKTKDAADYFNKSLVADKTYSVAIDNLGTMDLNAGKLDDAQKKFSQSLTYNTQNTTAMYHLAQIAMQKQDYPTALTQLNNALAINSNSPAIYNLMGKAYVAQGNEAAAINAFKKSILVKPEFTLSYLDLAQIYEKRTDGEFAIEQLKTALSINPDYSDAKLKIADISLSNGNYTQAIACYSELVGIDGYNEAALKGLANSYYGQAQVSSSNGLFGSNKDLYKALDYINKAISADNKDLELHLAKLKLTKITNQPELSKAELNKIIQMPGTDMSSMVTKGEAYLAMNDYSNSQKAFNNAVKLSQTPQNDLYLSEIFLYHKQYDSAEKVLNKILKYDAQNPEALADLDYIQKCKKRADNYYKSAQSSLKSKNTATAMEYLSRSITLNPSNANVHYLMAQLCEKQKDYSDAATHYKAYLGLVPNSAEAKKIQKKISKYDNGL